MRDNIATCTKEAAFSHCGCCSLLCLYTRFIPADDFIRVMSPLRRTPAIAAASAYNILATVKPARRSYHQV